MTPEERRASIVERIGAIISGAPFPSTRSLGKAEKILALLESGEAGVRVVPEGDIQAVVGVVLRQKREAEAARDDALAKLAETESIAYQNAVELTRALEQLSLLRAENQRLRDALDGR